MADSRGGGSDGNRPGDGGARRGRVHLVIGPVGAGKSTFAMALASELRAVRLTLDEWMSELFAPDRPDSGVIEWYVARAARAVSLIGRVAVAVVDADRDTVLEIGLLSRAERERFFARVDAAGVALSVHVVEASRDVRRARVEARQRARGATCSRHVPPAIFELASDLWQPPDDAELAGRDARWLRTDLPAPALGEPPGGER
jgi:predicted kinase